MPDRIEREIEDILNKLDDFVPDKGQKPIPFRKPAKRRGANGGNRLTQRLAKLSLNQIMLYALIALVAGFLLRSMPFASWVMIGALVILVAAFFLSMRAGSGRGRIGNSGYEKRWRGEPIDLSNNYSSGAPTLGDRIVRWFKRRH
jgi:hypothetical protein